MATLTRTLSLSPLVKKELLGLLELGVKGHERALTAYVTLLREQGTRVPSRLLSKLLGEAETILSCNGDLQSSLSVSGSVRTGARDGNHVPLLLTLKNDGIFDLQAVTLDRIQADVLGGAGTARISGANFPCSTGALVLGASTTIKLDLHLLRRGGQG